MDVKLIEKELEKAESLIKEKKEEISRLRSAIKALKLVLETFFREVKK